MGWVVAHMTPGLRILLKKQPSQKKAVKDHKMADNTISKPVVISFVKKKRPNEVSFQSTAFSKRIKLNQTSNLSNLRQKSQQCQYCGKRLKNKPVALKTHLRSCPSLEKSETITQFNLQTLDDDEDGIDCFGVVDIVDEYEQTIDKRDSNENLYSFTDMNEVTNGSESDSKDDDLIEIEENLPVICKSEKATEDCLENDSEISILYECPICSRKYLFEKIVFDHIENYHKITKDVQSKLGFEVIVLQL